MIKLAIALLMLLAMASTAVAATACRSAPGSTGAHWAWRSIDGRTCWYQGERGRDKSLLFWAREASAAPVPVPAAATTAAPTEPPPPIAAPEPEPPALSAEDQALLESYWPDLATLVAQQWPPAIEAIGPPPSRGRDDPLAFMVLALVAVSALALGLERLTIARHG